jgi:hypothetical protein
MRCHAYTHLTPPRGCIAGAIRGSGTTSNVRADLFGSERSCLDNKLENNQADFEVCLAHLPLLRQLSARF